MYSPKVIQIAAVFAIVLAFVGKFSGFLHTVPVSIIGGISMMLYGMIASVGLRTLANAQLDFSHSRNLIIVSLILVVGLGVEISGIAVPAGAIIVIVTGLLLSGLAWSIVSKTVENTKTANILTGVIVGILVIVSIILVVTNAFGPLLNDASVVSGLFLAAVIGVVLNMILPQDV